MWGIHPHTAVWTCRSYEMSLSWWEGKTNSLDRMSVGIVQGENARTYPQIVITRHQLRSAPLSASAFLHLIPCCPGAQLHRFQVSFTHSLIHSLMHSFIHSSDIHPVSSIHVLWIHRQRTQGPTLKSSHLGPGVGTEKQTKCPCKESSGSPGSSADSRPPAQLGMGGFQGEPTLPMGLTDG